MRIQGFVVAIVCLLAACGGSSGSDDPPPSSEICPANESNKLSPSWGYAKQASPGRILVFSKTAGFRHDSIEAGQAMLQALAADNGWDIELTEDSDEFTAENLQRFAVVVWLNTTGNVLNASQQAAFESYIETGGGYLGIHSAADTEYDWPWYGNLVGAYFHSHPHNQTANLQVEDSSHPASAHLDHPWIRFDEWYNYQTNPRDRVNVLLSLDENSYSPGAGAMGDHPIAWYHSVEAGRAFYTGLGHTIETYSEPDFIEHIKGGLIWAGRLDVDVPVWHGPPPPDDDFSMSYLAVGINEPMALRISADNNIYVIGRRGEFYAMEDDQLLHKSTIPVNSIHEGGLIGFALDPDFIDNRWVYLHYTDALTAEQHISRLVLNSDNTLDMESEQKLLSYPVDFECCHVAGDMVFDSAGHLYIATGDNTNPFASSGYAPIDERPGREFFDAQRTSANTNDLRGKILRITPTEDGGYTIPEGNLFVADELHRGEIYAMGNRNPFRITIDSGTDWLFWADVGPDAASASAVRGPAGYDLVNRTALPGNFGWPYFSGNNEPYNIYDFATGESGELFDPNNVVNHSVNNTGATNLPDAQPAWITMSRRALMAGEVYRWNNNVSDPYKLPSYFNGRLLFWNFNNDTLYEARVDQAEPEWRNWLDTSLLTGMIDAEISPVNNRLYLLGYGANCCSNPPNAGMLTEVLYIGSGPETPEDPPQIFAPGDTITLAINGQFVSASPDGSLVLLDNRTGNREVFDLVDAGNDTVALRSAASGLYVTAGQGGAAPLSATGDSIGLEQQFYLHRNQDGSYALESLANCHYVSVQGGGSGSHLVADATGVGAAQIFSLNETQACSSDPDNALDCLQNAVPYLNMPKVVDENLSGVPGLLSQTGTFADVSSMAPSGSLVPYDVISPLWSDRARKDRWVSVPAGSQIGWSETGKWQWPEGTVFVKHFELPVDEGNPSQFQRLETRLLVVQEGGAVYGVTYQWRDDHSDADLLKNALDQDIVVNSPNGDWTQTWTYPSPADCLTCHNPEAQGVLGVKTASLNRSLIYPGGVIENQLYAWNGIGLFSEDIGALSLAELPAHAALDDNTASLEHRLRSYWDSNCSNCHGTQGIASAWDARFETPMAQQGIINGDLADQRDYFSDYGLSAPKVIDPGDKDNSILYIRNNSVDPDDRMPPLGTALVDELYMEVLEAWIGEIQ